MSIPKKYKDSYLPVFLFDDNSIEGCYVNVLKYDGKKIYKNLERFINYTSAFENILNYGFYYSYNMRCCRGKTDGGFYYEYGHTHAHAFDEVVRDLYYQPESFTISKEDLELYSKQELKYLKLLKYYLIAIGLKDINYREKELDRVLKSNAKDYFKYGVLCYKYAKNIFSGEITSIINYYYDVSYKDEDYILLFDDEHNYYGKLKTINKVINIDDLTDDMINYKVRGYNSLDDFKMKLKEEFTSEKVVYNNIEILECYNNEHKFIVE